MSLWEILVLGTVRLNMNMDYDMLYDQSNHHKVLRGILGVDGEEVFREGKYYGLQTLKDNVSLLTEELLIEISAEVVKAGHELKKKEGVEKMILELKTDSYVVESHVHFPTDINLLWDSIRKSLDIIKLVKAAYDISGWRKLAYHLKLLKRSYIRVANIHQRKGKNYHYRLSQEVENYVRLSKRLEAKMVSVLDYLIQIEQTDVVAAALLKDLVYYKEMLDKHIDLLSRRILKGEQIPHEEKVFSIFESHVEWIQKGKHHKKVEIGHNVLVTSDQYHFIIDHKVMEQESDATQPIALLDRLTTKYEKAIYDYYSISFDKGFYSGLSKKGLQKHFELVVMPKKGKANKEEQIEQSEEEYKALRNKHSAVESNINELEQSGLDRVKDKGIVGFKRYVALGVLSHNIKKLGSIVITEKKLGTIIQLGPKRKAVAA